MLWVSVGEFGQFNAYLVRPIEVVVEYRLRVRRVALLSGSEFGATGLPYARWHTVMTMTNTLGRLEPVDPRKVWPSESHAFTPWLLTDAQALSEAVGMDLNLEAAEHAVGSFSLDLIGVDTATGDRVIVENQLESSDHNHLGQILTYAGGTDPANVLWLATSFREEHRAALEWLNGGRLFSRTH